ncbi:MAG: GNAT family N-acetyltransferase [Planctomycetaceae bacterium]|nr:GNAT family N-acetyltransferase [Planctomycetaceae bacterium]
MVSPFPFRIRPAIPADAPGILDLIHELAAYEKLSAEVVATPEKLRETLFGQAPAAECLLAEQGERVVGMAIFFTNYSTFLAQPGVYLEDLYVRDEQRGQGIGKALLTAVARLAVQRGCGRMEWAVLDWNQPAIDFYESLGASPQQEWTVYRLTGASLQKFGDA